MWKKGKETLDMSSCLMTLRSATYAMRAQTILINNGISARSVKLDDEYTKKGCTHGVRFDCRNRSAAERLLREQGIPYSDIRTQ